jgi:zona occludens toxin
MAINAYTGLMGHGKSYEVVKNVVVPALNTGRRVVTNVDGIDGPAIAAYCAEKFGTPLDACGTVVHIHRDAIMQEGFFPGEGVDGFVKPGDMVVIDEAWAFWGTGEKISKEHATFFRMHRHYTDPETKRTCDLVVISQDLGVLHRQLKAVVELTFVCKKHKSFGTNKTYTVLMYEGHKIGRVPASKALHKFSPEIFALYSSYDVKGATEKTIDKRQNVFGSKGYLIRLALGVVFMLCMVYWVVGYFRGSPAPAAAQSVQGVAAMPQAPIAGTASPLAAANAGAAAAPSPWRISGMVVTPSMRMVALVDGEGRLRLENPSNFTFLDGRPVVGTVDGLKVQLFGGAKTQPTIGRPF